MKTKLLIFVFVLPLCVYAQPGNFNLIYTYPGYNFFAEQLLATNDGGFIISGYEQYQQSGFTVDPMLRKFDAYGNFQWSSRVGAISYDRADGIVQLTDSSYYIVCSNNSLNTNYIDFYVAHLSSTGVPISATNYSYVDSAMHQYLDYASGISLFPDGNILITGYTREYNASTFYTSFIMKLDLAGNILWCTRTSDISLGQNYFYNQYVSPSGKIIAGGSVNMSPNRDFLVASYDSSGNNDFLFLIGTSGDDYAYDIKPTPDGGMILAGISDSSGTYMYDNMIMKLDSAGNVQWSHVFGTAYPDFLFNALVMADGSFLFTGFSYINGTDTAATLYHFTSSGNPDWCRYFSDPGGQIIGLATLESSTDSSLFMCGKHFVPTIGSTSIYLSHIVNNNDTSCIFKPFIVSLTTPTLHNYALSSFSNPVFQQTGSMILSYFPPAIPAVNLCLTTTGIENPAHSTDFLINPNPVTDALTIQSRSLFKNTVVEILNMSGQRVLSRVNAERVKEIKIDLKNIPAGIYIIRIFSNANIFTRKLMKY